MHNAWRNKEYFPVSRLLDKETVINKGVDDLFHEISDLKIRVVVPHGLFENLPASLKDGFFNSSAIELAQEGVNQTSPIIFHDREGIDFLNNGSVHIVLLDENLRAFERHRHSRIRVGLSIEIEEARRGIMRSLQAGFEISQAFDLDASNGPLGALVFPAVAVQQLAADLVGQQLSYVASLRLILHHYITRNTGEALLALAFLDEHFGSDFTNRYKAITGAFV